MTVTKELVQALRARTNAGILDCKKFLIETNGDVDAAAQKLREAGIAKADKKLSRQTSEGRVFGAVDQSGTYGFVCTLNCETDFVADSDSFLLFMENAKKMILNNQIATKEDMQDTIMLDGSTFDDARKLLVSTLGENIQVGQFYATKVSEGYLSLYEHHDGKRCVLVHMSGGDDQSQVARDIAMHILVTKPLVIHPDDLKDSDMRSQLEVFGAQVEKMNKPENIAEKIMAGKIDKYKNEISLMGQSFVKNPEIKVSEFLKQHSGTIHDFACVVMGEDLLTS